MTNVAIVGNRSLGHVGGGESPTRWVVLKSVVTARGAARVEMEAGVAAEASK